MALPIAPLVWVAIWAARAVARSGKGTSSGGGGPGGGGASVQRSLSLPFRFTNFIRFWTLISWPAALALLLDPSDPLYVGYLLFNLALAVFNLPAASSWALARLLPEKLAFYIIDLLMPRWAITSSRAGAALTVLRARAGRGPIDPMLLEWLDLKLYREVQPAPLSVVAYGAIALASGQRERGVALLRAAATLPKVPGRDPARAIAMDWLLADALERGDVHGAIQLGLRRAVGSTRPPPLRARVVASALLGASCGGAPRHLRTLMWLFYPRITLGLRPLLERLQRPPLRPEHPLELARARASRALLPLIPAWARRRGAALGIGLPPASTPGAPAAEALSLHRDLLLRRHPLAEEVAAVAAAWDQAPFDLAALRSRLDELRCSQPADELAEDHRRMIVSDLTELLVAHRQAPSPGGPTLEAARELALGRLRPGIDDLIAEIKDEERAGKLEASDLYALWQRLRDRLEQALALASAVDRRQLIVSTFGPILDFAAWAHNKQRQRLFARVIMLWLLELGEGVCAPRFMDTVLKNSKLRI